MSNKLYKYSLVYEAGGVGDILFEDFRLRLDGDPRAVTFLILCVSFIFNHLLACLKPLITVVLCLLLFLCQPAHPISSVSGFVPLFHLILPIHRHRMCYHLTTPISINEYGNPTHSRSEDD